MPNKSRMDEVIEDEFAIPAEDRNLVSLETMRFLHTTMDSGRPSDAARTICRQYQRLGGAEFSRRFMARRETERDVSAYAR